MDINNLIILVKRKLKNKIKFEDIEIIDKSFLHKNHISNTDGKFHLQINIKSEELKDLGRIKSDRIIYSTIKDELEKHIHSLSIRISK